MSFLSIFLPEKSVSKIHSWINELEVVVKVKNPRRTKLGDFRVIDNKLMVSINNNLNPYAFLLTLTHELAHAKVYREYNNIVHPHGVEWKNIFQTMLFELISLDIFPKDILRALSLYVKDPKASTFSDINLSLALRGYNKNETLVISDLEENARFITQNQQVFIKKEKKIKRYRCIHESSSRVYFFHPLTQVTLIK